MLLISVMRLLILMFSFYGYLQAVSRKVRAEFAIGIVFSAIGGAVFLAGILNILKIASFVICGVGVYLAVRSVMRKESPKRLMCFGTVFFAVSCVYLFFILHDMILVEYDNFSHWGIVTKLLLRKDRFPNYTDINIAFQSYPLGSASFIYYIVTITGIGSEWMWLFTQAFLMSGFLTSLFAFAKSWPQKIVTALACVIFIAGNTSITDLLVDTLLPVAAVGGISFCLYYRKQIYQHIWWVLPYIVFLTAIKNSGIFFALVILGYLLSKGRSRRDLSAWVTGGLCAAATLVLWQRHVKLVFDNGMMSYHSLSLDYFGKMFNDKDDSQIQTILSGFMGKMFSYDNHVLWLAGMLAVVVVIDLLRKKKDSHRDLIWLAVVSYLIYQVMTCGMYLLTMPKGEAIRLAAYDRYHDTILIFVAGIVLTGMLEATDDRLDLRSGGFYRSVLASVICLVCLFYAITPNKVFLTKRDPGDKYRGRARLQYDAMVDAYQLKEGKRCAILIKTTHDSANPGFLRYLTKYLLDPSVVVTMCVDDCDPEVLADRYDYLIVFDSTDDIVEFLEVYFPNYSAPCVIELTK